MHPEVNVIEWDGAQFLGVTIGIYCFVFVVEDFVRFDLTLYREFQCWQDGWCPSTSVNFEPRPDLAQAAKQAAMECWHLFRIFYGHSPEHRPARRLYQDPFQDRAYRPRDLANLVNGVAAARDMNKHLGRPE